MQKIQRKKIFDARYYNARKVISEVYAFFVMCSVFGRKSKHKTDVEAWHGILFHKNNLWNILVIGNYYMNYQNYQNLMLLTSSDTKRTLMHLLLFTNSAQRELVKVSICTQSIHDRNWLSLPYILVSNSPLRNLKSAPLECSVINKMGQCLRDNLRSKQFLCTLSSDISPCLFSWKVRTLWNTLTIN